MREDRRLYCMVIRTGAFRAAGTFVLVGVPGLSTGKDRIQKIKTRHTS